jgi:MFS family permease
MLRQATSFFKGGFKYEFKMLFFHTKREVVTRSYDVLGAGFSPLPLNKPTDKIPDEQEFTWSIGLIRDIIALFSSILLSSIGYGILMVMIAFRLEEFVKNEVLMSVSSATQIFAGIIFARFLPDLGRKIGLTNSIRLALFTAAICALLMAFYVNFILWILVIFIYGTSAFICGVTRQAIMIDLAPKNMKALMISFGTISVALGNSFGPIFLQMIKTQDHFITFAIAATFFLTAIIPLHRLKKIDADIREEKKIGIWRYIQNSPKIMFAGFCVNYAMSSINSFLIIYGIKVGMTQNDASLLLSTLLFGTIFSIPVGYLADILNRRFLMIFSACLSLLCLFCIYFNDDINQIYTLLFLTCGCVAGMKLPAIVLINEKYKPTQRLAVNSAFARFSLMGNVVGIFTTGFIMNLVGPKGLWLSDIIILQLFLLFCFCNYLKKIKDKNLDLKNFSIFNNKNSNEKPSEI